MGPAADEALEAGVAVGVHPTGEASQMLLGMMGLAVGGKPVPSRRLPFAGPGTLVTHVRPGTPRRGLARSRGQHLDRRVIDKDRPTGEHVATDRIGQRLKQRRRLAHPTGERRALQLHPLSGVDPALTIQRK